MVILVLIVISIAGGLIFKKLKVPAGAMIGAMLAIAVVNSLLREPASCPIEIRIAMQICSGLIIGSRLTKRDLIELRVMLFPVLILIVMLLSITFLFSYVISHISSVSFITAFFATAPGGMTDLAIIAADFGANVEQVAVLQLCRFMFVVSVFPPLMRKLYLNNGHSLDVSDRVKKAAHPSARFVPSSKGFTLFILYLVIAAGGGLLFRFLEIPAGPMLGAMIVIVMINIIGKEVVYPDVLRTIVQLAAGFYIGSRFTADTLRAIPELAVPILCVIAEIFVMAFGTAFVVHRVCRISFPTALFSCTPGGITEMSLIAEEMHMDTAKIVLMHTCRLIATIGLVPIIVSLFG